MSTTLVTILPKDDKLFKRRGNYIRFTERIEETRQKITNLREEYKKVTGNTDDSLFDDDVFSNKKDSILVKTKLPKDDVLPQRRGFYISQHELKLNLAITMYDCECELERANARRIRIFTRRYDYEIKN
jgi:hypothetical protein